MESIRNKVYTNSGNIDVLNNINLFEGKILDVGCGRGDNARNLKENNNVIDGITFSEEEAKEAKAFMRNIYIHNLENGLPNDCLSEKYDVVVCSHVLEHICYPQQLLSDIHQVLKSNGYLIVALPNIMHYKSRFQLLSGNFNYKDSGVWDYTHFRWYTFKTGHELLIKGGFKVEKAYVSGDIPFLSIFKFLPVSLRQILFKMLTKISKGFFGGQLIYVGTKY